MREFHVSMRDLCIRYKGTLSARNGRFISPIASLHESPRAATRRLDNTRQSSVSPSWVNTTPSRASCVYTFRDQSIQTRYRKETSTLYVQRSAWWCLATGHKAQSISDMSLSAASTGPLAAVSKTLRACSPTMYNVYTATCCYAAVLLLVFWNYDARYSCSMQQKSATDGRVCFVCVGCRAWGSVLEGFPMIW